jgi:hypothetical protein
MISDMTEPDAATARGWRPERRLRPWGLAVLGLSALWTAVVWVRFGMSRLDAGQRDPLLEHTQPVLAVTIVVTWLVTSGWLGRLHDAARWVAPQQQRHTRVWATLGWIVPIVQLWFPKGVVDDAWRALERLPGRNPRVRTGWWWLAWLVAGFVTTPSVYSGGNDANEVVTLGFATALTVAWLLWARIVVGLTVAHDG